MAKARAIVKRLKAVKNIRKITRTMELIATARFKKAMDRATEAAAYTRKISELVADLSESNLAFKHPLLEAHQTGNQFTAPGADVQSRTVRRLQQQRPQVGDAANSPAVERHAQTLALEVSGKRGLNFLKFQGQSFDESYTHFEDKPSFDQVEALANRYIDLVLPEKAGSPGCRPYVKFESGRAPGTRWSKRCFPCGQLDHRTSAKERRCRTVIRPAAATASARAVQYEFLPSAQEILEEIVPAAFKARLFKCFLDAAVSEQIYRMVAMKGATKNAADMIGDLTRLYNRARQSQITSELSEIIGGAAALE